MPRGYTAAHGMRVKIHWKRPGAGAELRSEAVQVAHIIVKMLHMDDAAGGVSPLGW